MTFRPRNLLIFGATGTIGRYILDAILSSRDEFERIVIFTSESTAKAKATFFDSLKQSKQIELVIGSIEDEEVVKKAYEGIDTVVSALGRGAIAAQIPLIKLARASPSVKWFFPSEYGTDIAYSPASANEKPHQQKLKVRKCLENPDEAASVGAGVGELAYTYVVTGPFAEMYVRFFGRREGGGWSAKEKKATLLGEKGQGRISLTTMRDVGILVMAALRHPDAAWNKALRVNSFTTTPAQILAEFERQEGGQPWSDVTYTSLQQLRDLEAAAWEAGSPDATVLTLRRIWTEGGTLYEKRDNELIGEPPMMTLKEVVKDERLLYG